MRLKLTNITLFFIFIIIIISLYNVLNYSTTAKIDELKSIKYKNVAKKMKEEFSTLLEEKRKTTLAIALLLSKNNYFIDAIANKKDIPFDLYVYSGILKEHSDFKNIWFQIINKDGVSVSRSWSNKKGDNLLNYRADLKSILKNKTNKTTISVGKFDLTLKAIVPILNKNKLVGIFEAISHLNSITINLEKKDIYSVIVVDEKYKKQLIHPFTNTFIGDNYIANINAKEKQINVIKRKGIKFFKNLNQLYYIDKESNQLVTVYKMYDIHNKPMSYVLLFKPLDKINISEISQLKTNMNFYIILLIIVIGISIYYFSVKKYHKSLKDEHNRIKLILDTQPNIMILIDNSTIIDVNSKFFEFFDQYKNLNDFLNEHDCICDLFEEFKGDDYIQDKLIHNKQWIKYILEESTKVLKVAIKKDDTLHHFIIKGSRANSNIVIVLVDITSEINIKNEMEYQNKLIFEQAKMVSMGEMIGNIAHQWRQPLSIITTAATSMQMEKEFGALSDDRFDKNCELINRNAQYLSNTIDDFKNFIKGERNKKLSRVTSIINSFLSLVEASSKNNNINMIIQIEKDIKIISYENELIQCLINIYNNAKDALAEKNIKDKYIMINANILNDNLIIKIKDNALGIPEDIIEKIFDLYFTTKHRSQGTGLGLSMTYKLITEGMAGTITVNNVEFNYNNQLYYGAEFIISLPIE